MLIRFKRWTISDKIDHIRKIQCHSLHFITLACLISYSTILPINVMTYSMQIGRCSLCVLPLLKSLKFYIFVYWSGIDRCLMDSTHCCRVAFSAHNEPWRFCLALKNTSPQSYGPLRAPSRCSGEPGWRWRYYGLRHDMHIMTSERTVKRVWSSEPSCRYLSVKMNPLNYDINTVTCLSDGVRIGNSIY
jgi:hypothetical protein